nr:TPA_asm: ND3 [Marinogammarus marinus]
MTTIIMVIALAILVASAILSLAFVLGKKPASDREKMTPFECGFDPHKKARAPFSLRFFLVTVLFLVFDVEIALMLPLALLLSLSDPLTTLALALVMSFILVAGLIHEWNQGALTWVS